MKQEFLVLAEEKKIGEDVSREGVQSFSLTTGVPLMSFWLILHHKQSLPHLPSHSLCDCALLRNAGVLHFP